jgi:uncharacterized membrane protein YvbJ
MSLIACPECQTQISSLALNCPKCGCPIARRADISAAGTPIVTTQATAKKFKGHMLIATSLCCIGVIIVVSKTEYSPLGSAAFLIGLVWFITARARAWWNNG